MSIEPAGELLTVREAAAELKVSTVTIKRYFKQGRLRAYRVGPRALRVKRVDLDQLVVPEMTGEPAARGYETAVPLPDPEELSRRRQLLEEILALRAHAPIAPLTTSDLVRRSRKESAWYGPER